MRNAVNYNKFYNKTYLSDACYAQPSLFKQGIVLPPPSSMLAVPSTSSPGLPDGKSTSKYAHLSVGKGDVDQAIRSMRQGVRRTRNDRPLSKIFLDGNL